VYHVIDNKLFRLIVARITWIRNFAQKLVGVMKFITQSLVLFSRILTDTENIYESENRMD